MNLAVKSNTCVSQGMRKYAFENLNVWQDARKLTSEIYEITKEFPDYERYAMANQIRRAAVSVCSNIAEGSGRSSLKDRQNFYRIAYASLMEVFNQLLISMDLEYIDEKVINDKIRPQIENISLVLYILKGKK